MGQKNDGTEISSVSTQRSESENLDAAPSVKQRFMKLASEVHKDVAKLREEKPSFINGDIDGKYLFNNSPAVRKLVVFLAVTSLSEIQLIGIKAGHKREALLETVLQPQMSGYLPAGMKFVKDNKKIGYSGKDDKEVVYYNDKGIFYSNYGMATDSTKALRKILVSVLKTMEKVLKTEKLTNNKFMKAEEVQDLTELDSETKKNIESVLSACLEEKCVGDKDKKSFSDKLRNAFMVFINFWKFGKQKKQQKPLELVEDTKDGAKVLSDFLKNQNNSQTTTKEEDEITSGS